MAGFPTASLKSASFLRYLIDFAFDCGYEKVDIPLDQNGTLVNVEKMFACVVLMGGNETVSANRSWNIVAKSVLMLCSPSNIRKLVRFYKKYVIQIEDISEVVDAVIGRADISMIGTRALYIVKNCLCVTES